MSKKEDEAINTQQAAIGSLATQSYIDELLSSGTVIITAATRDELAEMINVIPADVRYAVGAIGHNSETGLYSLRVDLSNN